MLYINMSEEEQSVDNDETQQQEGQDIQFFKKAIQEYLKQEEEIKVLQKAITQRRDKKKNLAETIMSFLEEKDISHVNLQGNYQGKRMESIATERLSTISEKCLVDVVNNFFENGEDAEKLLGLIQSTRKKTQNTKLKVGREKKQKGANSTTLTKLVEEGRSEEITDVPEHMQYLYTNVDNQ